MHEVVRKIGSTDLWMGRLALDKKMGSVADLQAAITRYVERTSITVTGCYIRDRHELLLLHWPETRDGYTEQSVRECEVSLRDLADALHADIIASRELEAGQISCMMGLKVGGYDDGRIAEISEIAQYQSQLAMTPAHMVSARARKDGNTESYGEPTVYLTGAASAESAIHAIGDQLEQHHYGIQRGSGVTDFYETKWATQEESAA